MKSRNLLLNDIRLQQRNGIYYAYGFVLLAYLSLLYFLGDYFPSWALGILVYTDPAVLGFFFLGALMMLEKSEGTRTALAITPMRAIDYYWSKLLSLTFASLVSVTLIGVFAHGNINWPLYLTTVIIVSATFVSIGFPIALHFKTATSYLMGSAGILTPILLPMIVALFDPFPSWAILIPPAAQLRLMLISVGTFEATMWETVFMLIVIIATFCFSMFVALSALKKEFCET